MGHHNVAVLNGGLPEWIKAGHATESKRPFGGKIGDFKAHYQAGTMKFFEDVKDASSLKTHVIMDARSEKRFKSLEPEPRAGLRMGTIPNSINLPYEDLMDGNELKQTGTLREIFKSKANKKDPIIFSCGSGLTACILALGADLSGYENISIYDGSWTEWGSLVQE